MNAEVNEVLNALRPGITADGGTVEQLESAADGSIRIHLQEPCDSSMALLWTHRLRIERILKEHLPAQKVVFIETCS